MIAAIGGLAFGGGAWGAGRTGGRELVGWTAALDLEEVVWDCSEEGGGGGGFRRAAESLDFLVVGGLGDPVEGVTVEHLLLGVEVRGEERLGGARVLTDEVRVLLESV